MLQPKAVEGKTLVLSPSRASIRGVPGKEIASQSTLPPPGTPRPFLVPSSIRQTPSTTSGRQTERKAADGSVIYSEDSFIFEFDW